jgi:hypothetical protein
MQDFDGMNPDQQREYLERLLSHPESAEALVEALDKAASVAVAQVDPPQEPPATEEPEKQSDTAITVIRHLLITGAWLGAAACFALAWSTPLKDTYDVCFNQNSRPNTSVCLGAKRYVLGADHVKELTQHSGLHIVPKDKGKPVQAALLALVGTSFAFGAGVINKQALKEKTEAVPVNRTNRRTGWTANKMEADRVIKERYQSLQHGFAVQGNADLHAFAASDSSNEFLQMQAMITAMPPEVRDAFFQHLALKEQRAMEMARLQAQAQQAQSPFAALLGGLPQHQITSGVEANVAPDDIEKAKAEGLAIIRSTAASMKSKVMVAPSRAGKTTVLYLYYNEMLTRYPEGEVFIVEDKREMIHPRIPVENYAFCDGETFKDAGLEMLNRVYDIYAERAQMAESKRDAIAQKKPIRLALIDWLATWSAVEKDKAVAPQVRNKLIAIITKGAGCGVAVDIDTHSANVEALGIDASTRESLDFISIAYCKQNEKGDLDRVSDGLGLLPKVISKALIVPDKGDRTRLGSEFTKLRDALLKGQFNSSIIFTTTGGNRIGITPQFERKTLGDLTFEEVKDEPEEDQAEDEEEREQSIEFYLLDAARAIKVYLESRERKQATFKQIRDQRSIRSLWKSATDLTRIAIEYLLTNKIIELIEQRDPVLGTLLETKEDDKVYKLS